MLTQIQKDQLTQLMNDCPIPKLKKVLDEGLPQFISGEITPIRGSLGVFINESDVYQSSVGECCLLGAAYVNKKENDDLNLNLVERVSITSAFDNKNYNCEILPSSIYDYVEKIRKVIFGC